MEALRNVVPRSIATKEKLEQVVEFMLRYY
jgi:hypothetical protein